MRTQSFNTVLEDTESGQFEAVSQSSDSTQRFNTGIHRATDHRRYPWRFPSGLPIAVRVLYRNNLYLFAGVPVYFFGVVGLVVGWGLVVWVGGMTRAPLKTALLLVAQEAMGAAGAATPTAWRRT